jgi:xanthine dehydrogenase accessory factor
VVTILASAARLLAERRAGALATALPDGMRALFDADGSVLEGDLPPAMAAAVAARVPDLVRAESSRIVDADGVEVFVEVLVPAPRLLLFGAGPIGEAVCAAASLAGFTVEVCDPRPAFARSDRFPGATSVVAAWPDEALARTAVDPGTYVVSVLHEARFEDQLLPAVLATDARYVGALGSRRTHEGRVARLRRRGIDEESIARIHAPVGLDIGATTPEEIAIAIVAEMVAVRRGSAR